MRKNPPWPGWEQERTAQGPRGETGLSSWRQFSLNKKTLAASPSNTNGHMSVHHWQTLGFLRSKRVKGEVTEKSEGEGCWMRQGSAGWRQARRAYKAISGHYGRSSLYEVVAPRVCSRDSALHDSLLWLLPTVRKMGVFLGKGLRLTKMPSCKHLDPINISTTISNNVLFCFVFFLEHTIPKALRNSVVKQQRNNGVYLA